jgi:hypothetical protein
MEGELYPVVRDALTESNKDSSGSIAALALNIHYLMQNLLLPR